MVEKKLEAKFAKESKNFNAFLQDVLNSINTTGVAVDNANYDLGTFTDRDYDVRIMKSFAAILQNIGLNSVDFTILGATKDFTKLDTDLNIGDFTEILVAEAALAIAVKATGTVTLVGVLAADTVTVNGLVYTAVAGVKSDNTEFSIDGSDTVDAADLADSITNDTRLGTEVSIDQTAANVAGVVTITAAVFGPAGDGIGLSSSNGARLAVSGANLAGGVDGTSAPFDLVKTTPQITAIKIRAKETAGGSPGIVRADVKASER